MSLDVNRTSGVTSPTSPPNLLRDRGLICWQSGGTVMDTSVYAGCAAFAAAAPKLTTGDGL